MSAPAHAPASSHSHARPGRLRRLFPVRRRATAIADAIHAGPQDPDAAQAAASLGEKITEAETTLITGAPLVPAPAKRGPVMTPEQIATLERVADRLRALGAPARDEIPPPPAAYLRDIVPGQDATHEPLRGFPAFAGTGRTPGGALAAGVWLGDGDGIGRFVLDGFEADWFRALEAAAAEAAEALEAARERAA
jgi:hypothetical protein